jgi:integrase
MKAYRQKLKEKDKDAFLKKQREDKAKQRAKAKENKIFEVPYVEPKKSVKIKVIKKATPPPLPSTLPLDIEDETPPPLPKTAPPSLTYKTKNIMKEVEKELNELSLDKPEYDVKKIVVEKAKRTKIEQIGNEVLEDLVKRMDKTNLIKASGPKINEASLKKYANNIKRLYENISGNPFDGDISFLYGIDAIQEFIEGKYSKPSTRTDYFKSIASILKRINGYEDIAKEYSKLMMTEKNKYDDDKGENELSEREKKNYVEWPDILKMPTDKLNDENYLLYKLYTALPPRRLDIKYLKLVKGKSKTFVDKLNKDYNYIVVDAKNNAQKIIYNKYKTSKVYKQFVIDLTKDDVPPYLMFSDVREAIKRYIEATGTKTGELIFPNTEGNIYVDFTRRIHEAFKPFLPKLISSNILRHSFLTWAYNHKVISINTMQMLAKYMSHSALEALSYRRFKSDKERDEYETKLKVID